MQPLKKFTQCSGLTLLFGVFIILFGVSSTALTTFGKSNIPSSTQAPAVKGRECTNHDDCSSLKDTSCVKDPDDYKLRCLCGDDSAPDNGFCKAKTKGLRHKCTDTTECENSMVCEIENKNETIKGGVSKIYGATKTKLCLCDEDNGYTENKALDICSGVRKLLTSEFMLIFSFAFPLCIYLLGVHY